MFARTVIVMTYMLVSLKIHPPVRIQEQAIVKHLNIIYADEEFKSAT